MASVVKKGSLDVKRKNKIGTAYKRKYVVLRRNTAEGTKLIEIYDSENYDTEAECVTLSGIWTVQDRESQNKKRFAFELVIGAHVMMTFSCPSLLERSEWTESFRILNTISSSSPVPPVEDMYHVILEHNVYSAEIGMSGPCLLRVQDGSIVLYSEDGAQKLHHWAFDNVENINTVGGQVMLDVHRPGSTELMQFRFNTDFNSSRNILIACSMLLENKGNKRLSSLSLNNVGLFTSSTEAPPTKSQSLSRSFLGSVKQSSKPFSNKEDKVVRRAKSFTDKSSYSIRRSLSPDMGFTGSVHSIASQESYAINRPLSQSNDDDGSPPPVPPRAPRRPRSIGMDTVDHIEPDYSYIKDNTDGDGRVKSTSSNGMESVDQQLEDLLNDIVEENRNKKRRHMPHSNHINHTENSPMRKVSTLGQYSTSRVGENIEKQRKEFLELYGDRGASDYLEPVPSKTLQEKRSSNSSQYKEWSSVNGAISKRLSSSSEYSTSFHSSSSSHDYHTIPDKPIIPQHGHTSSVDSTHTDSVMADRKKWARTLSGSDEPPSPPLPPRPSYLTRIPPGSPTKPTSSLPSSKKGDISPYAVSKGLIMPSDNSPAPPLPPRSPNKHHRDKIASATLNNRCQKCNGVKATKSSTMRQPHRLPPSPPSEKENGGGTIQSKPRPKSQPPESDKENTSSVYGYGSEIDSALQMLDDCVRGLNVMDVDTSSDRNTSPKSSMSLQTDIDEAIKCAREVGSDLSQPPIKRAASLYSNTKVTNTNPCVPPRSQVSLVHGGTQTTPKRHFPSPSSASSITMQNGSRGYDYHAPLTRYHSSMLPSEISSNTVRAHDIRYN